MRCATEQRRARLIRRRDSVTISVSPGRIAEGVMRLSMLLAREYYPYWKWLAAEFRKLRDVDELGAKPGTHRAR